MTGPLVDAAWERVRQTAAAGDYLSASAPGSIMPSVPTSPIATQSTEPNDGHHLAVIEAQVQEIVWLELARSGHRRARLRADTWDWLTP